MQLQFVPGLRLGPKVRQFTRWTTRKHELGGNVREAQAKNNGETRFSLPGVVSCSQSSFMVSACRSPGSTFSLVSGRTPSWNPGGGVLLATASMNINATAGKERDKGRETKKHTNTAGRRKRVSPWKRAEQDRSRSPFQALLTIALCFVLPDTSSVVWYPCSP